MTSSIVPDEMYLIAYGVTGTLGYFVPEDQQVNYPRGSCVMVRTERGREKGTVLTNSLPLGLPAEIKLTPGVILGFPSDPDVAATDENAEPFFAHARQLARELHLPLEIIDLEWLSDPATAVLHVLHFGQVDTTEMQSSLAARWQRRVLFHDMTSPEALEEAVDQGCQSCGSGGGCGSGDCESGGCLSGSCSSSTSSNRQFQHDWKNYFAELRRQGMDHRHT